MKQKHYQTFRMLYTLVVLSKGLAWISFAIGIIFAGMIFFVPATAISCHLIFSGLTAWLSAIIWLIGGTLMAMIWLITAESTYWMLSLHENMQKLRQLLDHK